MNNKYGLLLCKLGPLCHGPIDTVQKEFEIWKKRVEHPDHTYHLDNDLRIVEYDFQTHDFNGKEIVERSEPLKFYSPNDLYNATPIRIENDLWRWTDMLVPELNIYFEYTISDIEIRILFDDGDHMLATFWLNRQPFMIGQRTCYNDGDDDVDHTKFITNAEVFWQAMDYLIKLNRPETNVVEVNELNSNLTSFGYVTFNLK